jgi:hypothetical protein
MRHPRSAILAALAALIIAACDSNGSSDSDSDSSWNLDTGFFTVQVAASDDVTPRFS